MALYKNTVTEICSDDDLDSNVVTSRLGSFGEEAAAQASLLATTINRFYEGTAILDKSGVADLEEAIIKLRHLTWLVSRVAESWKNRGDVRGDSFEKHFAGKVRSSLADAEVQYGELVKVIKG